MVVRFGILIGCEVRVALEQTEFVAGGKTVNRYLRRVQQWLPDPIARGIVDKEPVGVVHFWAPGVTRPRRVLAIVIHAGQGCDAKLLDSMTREQHRSDAETGGRAGRDQELVGASEAWTVEQRIHGHALCASPRTYEPELDEVGELFARGESCVDSRASNRKTPLPALADAAEVARAGEYKKLSVNGSPIERVTQLEARISQIIRDSLSKFRLVKREMILAKREAPDVRSVDFVDRHDARVHAAGHHR